MQAQSTPRLVLITVFAFAFSPVLAQYKNPSPPRVVNGGSVPPSASTPSSDTPTQPNSAQPTTTSDPSKHRAKTRDARARHAKPEKREAPAHRLMNKRVESIDWVEEPLEDVIDWLREQDRVNVVVLWRTLDYLGVDKQTPVTLTLQNVTCHTILTEVCEQLAPGNELGFQAYGDMVRIAAQEYFDRVLYTRVYDVADLIWEPREFIPPNSPVNSLSLANAGIVGGGGEIDTYRFPEERRKELADALRKSIAPHQWEENGGDWSLTVWQNTLIVRAPMRIHQQLVGEFYLP